MVALFADMPREEIRLACSRYHYRIKRVTKTECVREKLFSCGFIVRTLYIYQKMRIFIGIEYLKKVNFKILDIH